MAQANPDAAPAAADRWKQLFQSGNARPETIRQLVTELSAAKKFEDVISLIEQALIQGKAQPWMYEVLALTMEIAGRPRQQIERVLLSSRDLTPGDVESLLFLAAYLARFERFPQAIDCCRQAAALAPNRPEPYAEALRLARRSGDIDAQAWAAIGVLTYAWGRDQQPLREEAQSAVLDVQSAYRQARRLMDLAAFEVAVNEARRVDLHIRLEWSGAGDLDLVVIEPSGTTCSRENRYSTGGGIFTHDGAGPAADNCYDEYACPRAWSGEYRVQVVHSWGAIVGKRATLIVTRAAGTPAAVRDVIPLAISADQTEVRIALKDGRRQAAAPGRPVSQHSLKPRPGRPTILQQLAPAGQVQPFNVGAAPVGGGVGYQPVIQFFNEGISMSAMATVSGDRRYVRITTVPVFSNITDVFTFSFQQ